MLVKSAGEQFSIDFFDQRNAEKLADFFLHLDGKDGLLCKVIKYEQLLKRQDHELAVIFVEPSGSVKNPT
jgi:hypothetical protein